MTSSCYVCSRSHVLDEWKKKKLLFLGSFSDFGTSSNTRSAGGQQRKHDNFM